MRLDDVRAALLDGPRTGFEVAAAIPWVQRAKRLSELADRRRFLAFGEALAHLECLDARGEVAREDAGVVLWRKTDQEGQGFVHP